ncbi:MAG: ATP-binding protein [Acidobacteriota bacterium]
MTNLTPSIGSVKVDPGQFEQVIVNLAINARDAMPEGGTLTIETAHVKPTQPQRREQSSARSGPAVCLFVRDTGQGMDSETRARIFEPFFTTKEVGKGTGLGLAMVYGVVTQSGGTIEADSEPGTGTTFTITLPQIQAATPTAEAPSAPTPLPTGTETILVVEDDPTVRAYVREVLTLSGYQVLQAAHTEEALRVCSSHAGPIHLLLTDVVMPGINGRRLAELVATLRPEAHVLFMSGYPKHATIRQGSQDESATLLQKPLAPDTLARAVREVLTA